MAARYMGRVYATTRELEIALYGDVIARSLNELGPDNSVAKHIRPIYEQALEKKE